MLRLALMILFAAFATAARAQAWLDQPGVAGSTVVDIGDVHIRLPPGEWRQAAEGNGSYQRIFVQSDGKRVIVVAFVSVNTTGPGGGNYNKGFYPLERCFQTDAFLNDSQDLYPGQWDCLLVRPTMMDWVHQYPTWQQASDSLRDLGGMPRPLISVTMAKAGPSTWGYAILRLLVNPAASGFTSNPNAASAQSEWHKDHLTPDRDAFLKKVATWAEAYRPIFRKSWE